MSNNMQSKYQATVSVPLLHPPPVHLSAPPLLLELKAGNPEDVEEAVAYHIRNAIIHVQKALSKPS